MLRLKKSLHSRRSYETSGLKRFMVVLLIVMACTGVLGLFWFLSQFGPKEVDYSAPTADVEISVEAIALREQSFEVEAQFEEVLAMRQAQPQDLLLLKRALDLKRLLHRILSTMGGTIQSSLAHAKLLVVKLWVWCAARN